MALLVWAINYDVIRNIFHPPRCQWVLVHFHVGIVCFQRNQQIWGCGTNVVIPLDFKLSFRWFYPNFRSSLLNVAYQCISCEGSLTVGLGSLSLIIAAFVILITRHILMPSSTASATITAGLSHGTDPTLSIMVT